MPGVRVRPVMANGESALDVRGVWTANVGDGRNDFPSDPHPANNLVRRDLVRDLPEKRHFRARTATGFRVRIVRHGMDMAA